MSIATVHHAAVASVPVPARTVSAPVSIEATKALVRGLNREQRSAVTHAGGPLLVVAGPGTGKTEVVTRRVAWLIAAKLARPSEILALTFTDNAAQEMQARVDMLVPYGLADAAIHTFHAFGDRLLREHAFELGLAGDVRLINRAEAIVVLREHLFELGLDRYLPLGDPTRFAGALVDLFGRAKDENVSADAFQAHADGLLAVLAGTGEQADPVLADVAGARAELARAYRAYCALLRRRGLIDHADQIALPLRLLQERPAIQAAVHARYRHILVDELQDANRVQLDFAFALTGPAGNVTVVGDPEQGIYSFRGAVRGNVGRFEAAYPGMRRIALRRNYRSVGPIIEASRRLVEHNVRPGEPMPLRQVAHRRARRPAAVRSRAYWTAELEADAIAADIAGRIADGARPSDFAVLMRSNSETDIVLRSLLVRGVAADNGARPDLTALPAVRSLLAFLRVVADPSNNLELYTLAASEPYSLAGEQLNPRLQASRRRQRSLWESLVESAESGSPNETDLRARALVEYVRAGIAMSASHSTGEVLHDYLRRSGLLARLARMSDDGPDLAGLRGIARFVQVIRGRASLLAHDRVALLVPHLERVAEVDTVLDADGPRPEHVAVLTVHRAKGLEFKVVYLACLVEGRFPVRSRPPLLALPTELVAADDDDDGLAEERRLFYVAMTRARDELWLSYHVAGPGGRGRRRPSPFVAEALDAPAPAPPGQLIPDGGDDVALIGRLLEPAPVPDLTAKPAGGALSLSFSQVDAYLTCPERYRLRYVVGLSSPAHHALAYGSALHQTIATFHLRQGTGTPMTEDELLAEFAANWTPDGFLSREHEEARYAAGQDALRRFRIEQLASAKTPIAIERPFRFRLGQDQIVGRVDRLDRTPDGTVITDYKSSDVREQKRADAKARDSLQLQVYALAHEAESGELPARVQLHFLDSGVVGSATPDRARLDKARQTLDAAASGIRSGNFAPRPSGVTCGYCPFREICPASAA